MAAAVVGTQRLELETDQFKPPAYTPPFPVKFNPCFSRRAFLEKAEGWLRHLKVDKVFNPKMYKMLVDMEITGLPAVIYTEAEEWGLEWACKFFYMLWIWDDVLDATVEGQSPESADSNLIDFHMIMMWTFPDDPLLRTRLEPFLDHLEGQKLEEKKIYIESILAEARTKPGTVYSKEASHICNVYLDLWNDAVTRATPEFCLRFAHYNQLWLLGCLKEIENRKRRTVPASVDEYVQIRKGTSAMMPCMVIVDMVYGLSTPNSWFYSPEMQRVLHAVNDIVSWHNDIWSFKREVLVEKDMFNMVLAISVHRKVPYKEAAEITTQMIYGRIADLQQAASELESVTPPEHRRALDLYIETGTNWVSGTHHWHSNSVRYQ